MMKSTQQLEQQLKRHSKAAKLEIWGKVVSFSALILIVAVVVGIIGFVASKGLATFFTNHVSLWDFLSGKSWNPGVTDANGKPEVGALPMIMGSFLITVLSAIVATPFAIGTAVFMNEISPNKGAKILQPVTELLVGFRPFFTGSSDSPWWFQRREPSSAEWVWDSVRNLCPVRHDFANGDLDERRCLRAVPRYYREASLALGRHSGRPSIRWSSVRRLPA